MPGEGHDEFSKAVRKGRPRPNHASFREAGRVLAGLGRDGIGTTHRLQIVNDVLVAVTAAQFGAIVVTANIHDFSLIEKHTPVRWILPN
jgi:predicted nucleic acid-binding protein